MKNNAYGKNAYRKAFATTSCMPNQKLKRQRSKQEQVKAARNGALVVWSMNTMGIFGIAATIFSAPLDTKWKIGMTLIFLITMFQVRVEESE